MALDTTVGGADADSYASLTEGNDYHSARLNVDAWEAASDDEKEAALKAACSLLDASFAWTGAAVDAVQALCWPRSGMYSRNGFAISETEIPRDLKKAQSELARVLLAADRTADSESDVAGLASLSVGSVSLSFKDRISGSAEEQVALRGPEFSYLSRMIPEYVRVLLVPSWYERPTLAEETGQDLMFNAINVND